ncbi:MAG: hypothetical protein ACKVON_15050 [Beijerinckiaceae bacterium]
MLDRVDVELMSMSSHALSLLQIVTGMLCAGAAFGVLLTTMLVRGTLDRPGGLDARFDLVYTDRTYILASILASIGALASLWQNIGIFIVFVAVAGSFQIAEHWLLPRMRQAVAAGEALPMTGTRFRFEFLQAACLLLVFCILSMPPLITLARVYGL